MKNILVLIHDDDGQEARLQAALDVARAFEGHLTCLDVAMLPAMVGDYAALGVEAMMMADERDRERANRRRTEARLAADDVPFTWIDVTGDVARELKDASRLADLIVLNREMISVSAPDMRRIVGETLISAKKPVLAVPAGAHGIKIDGNAVVAWDGSVEAEAALIASVPLLRRARSVVILWVDDGSVTVPATEAATYLSRYGIKPIVRRIAPGLDRASTAIIVDLRMHHPAYLVMGGFSHPRFLEQVFGSVTTRLLKDSPVPLFLAH